MKVKATPYMTADMRSQIETILGPHVRDDEDLVSALERIVRERDVKKYDEGKTDHAIADARGMRMLLGAILYAQPDQRITVSPKCRAMVSQRDQVSSFEDVATGDVTYYLISR